MRAPIHQALAKVFDQTANFGYILDNDGHCAYVDAYNRELERTQKEGGKLIVEDKTCCTQMRNFKIWTCGMRLPSKDTIN